MKCHAKVNYSSAWRSAHAQLGLNVPFTAKTPSGPCSVPGCVQGSGGPERRPGPCAQEVCPLVGHGHKCHTVRPVVGS